MVRVTTLGESQVKLRCIRLQPGSGLNFSVALFLAMEAGRQLARGKMRAMFWPGVPETIARHSLRQLIYMIRHAGGQVTCSKEFVSLAAHTVTLDYTGLTADPAADPSLLLRPFLPEYDPRISAEHEKWVQSLRDKGHARLRDTLLRAIGQYRLLARWTDVEAAARRCLELDPLNEEATLSLAEAVAMGGRKLAAIRILDRYREDIASSLPALQLPVSVLQHRISELLPVSLPSAKEVAFVGRTNPLVELGAQFIQLRYSRGGSFHVWGPPGIGKSRLISELARVAVIDGIQVIRLTCSPHPTHHPGAVLRQLAAALLRLPGAIGCTPSSLDRMRTLVDSYSSILDLEGVERRAIELTADALVDLADAVSHEQALLIILDEADRIDRLSKEPFARLCSAVHDRPILVISSGREAAPVISQSDSGVKSIELQRLSPADSANLLRAFSAGSSARMGDEFVARCIALADGNPALLVDLGFHWATEGTSFQFPQSVISAVSDRFAQLTDDARRLLQLCAVFATECTVERVLRTNLYDQATLLKTIDELGRFDLVRLEKTSLIVADPLMSSQLLTGMSETGLRYLHHLAALSLEAELQIPHYRVLVWHCARHHKYSGNSTRALELLTTCADHLLQESKLSEAIATLRRAKKFCTVPEESIRISERLVRALRLAEQWRHVLQTVQVNWQHRHEAKARRDDHGDVELASLAARWHLDHSAASIVRDASRCLFDEASPPQHRTGAAVQLLIVAHNMGDPEGMHVAYAAVSDLKVRTPNCVSTLTAEMIYHSAVGDLGRAEAISEQLLTVARTVQAPAELALTLRQAAVPLRFVGRFEEARALLTEALATTTALEANYGSLKAADMIGTTFLEQGRLTEAWEWYLNTVQWIGGIGDPQSSTYSRNLGAKVALLQHKNSTGARLAQMRLRKILNQSVLRLRCDELALWIGLSLEKGTTEFDVAAVRMFEHTFAKLKTLGNQDFAAYVLVRLKQMTGAKGAASFLDEYANRDRRETSQLPDFLLDLRHSLS